MRELSLGVIQVLRVRRQAFRLYCSTGKVHKFVEGNYSSSLKRRSYDIIRMVLQDTDFKNPVLGLGFGLGLELGFRGRRGSRRHRQKYG